MRCQDCKINEKSTRKPLVNIFLLKYRDVFQVIVSCTDELLIGFVRSVRIFQAALAGDSLRYIYANDFLQSLFLGRILYPVLYLLRKMFHFRCTRVYIASPEYSPLLTKLNCNCLHVSDPINCRTTICTINLRRPHHFKYVCRAI